MQVLRSKYLKDKSIFDVDAQLFHKPPSSWRAILAGVPILQHGVMWRVGNGNRISFWLDIWTLAGQLIEHLIHPLNPVQDSHRICDKFQNGWWDIATLQQLLPPSIIQTIVLIHVSVDDHDTSSLRWRRHWLY